MKTLFYLHHVERLPMLRNILCRMPRVTSKSNSMWSLSQISNTPSGKPSSKPPLPSAKPLSSVNSFLSDFGPLPGNETTVVLAAKGKGLVAYWAPTFFASRSVPAGSSSPHTAITTIEQTWLTHMVYALLMSQLLEHLTNSHHPFQMRSIPSPHEPSNL